MLNYIARRLLQMIPTLIGISIVSFVVIQLPPGDYVTWYVQDLIMKGVSVDDEQIAALVRRFGVDQHIIIRYFKWVSGVVRGDFGYSFQYGQSVSHLIGERLGLTMVISAVSMIAVWILAFPIGLFSARRQYSVGDYIVNLLAFIGLATPSFLLALIFMWIAFVYFGETVGGLQSSAFVGAPFSLAKLLDLLKHLWIPVLVLSFSGIGGLVRTFRANLLDEMNKPYVVTARAKGLPEQRLLYKYPVRIALIPFISTVGWMLPGLISGEAILAVTMDLETTGPLLLQALVNQDMYLAGSFIMILSVATVVGTLVSDILLAWIDPRIRYE